MGSWNYRVIRSQQECYGIHEVYYDCHEQIESWTMYPIDVFGDTEEELRDIYEMMAEAFNMPILDENELLERAGKEGQIDNSYEEDEDNENWDDDPLDNGLQ